MIMYLLFLMKTHFELFSIFQYFYKEINNQIGVFIQTTLIMLESIFVILLPLL